MVVLYDMVMLADFLQPNTKIIITLNCKDFISMVLKSLYNKLFEFVPWSVLVNLKSILPKC